MAGQSTLRVRGVTYTNPDEAYIAAEELEHHADDVAAGLRASGKDGEADTVQDRGHADAEKLRAWARDRETTEAARTEQPADRPRASGRARRRRASGRRSSSRSRSGSTFTPRTRSIARGTGIPQAASSASSLVLQVAGLTLGIALLTLVLTRRGVQAFSDLAAAGANGISWIIEPVDPLAPRPKPVAAQGASTAATAYARSGAATRHRVPAGALP
jgi:hypothetical protein